MANTQIQAGFVANGQIFATRAEAVDFMRKPQIESALKVVAGGDANLAKFLSDNEDEILKAFESGVVARVTKAEKKRLGAALDELKNVVNPKLRFLQDNVDAIAESFRWPSVKRMSEEEKAVATIEALTKLADSNAAKWIVANRKQIENAYNAGIEKRAAPPAGGLAEYLAAKKAGPEALKAYQDAKAAAKAEAAAAAKKA
jgi:hypothetical protein